MEEASGNVVWADFKKAGKLKKLSALNSKSNFFINEQKIFHFSIGSDHIEILREYIDEIEHRIEKLDDEPTRKETGTIQYIFDKMLYLIWSTRSFQKVPKSVIDSIKSINVKFDAINAKAEDGIYLQPREIGDICEYIYNSKAGAFLFITALSKALLRNDIKSLKKLLVKNKDAAKINQIDASGYPQLFSMVYFDKEITKLLLEHGLDPLFHRHGWVCILEQAILICEHEIVTMLLEHCEPTEVQIQHILETEDAVLNDGRIIHPDFVRNRDLLLSKVDKRKLLSIAIKANSTDRVFDLGLKLAEKGDLTIEDRDFLYALKNDNNDIVKLLLKHSKKPIYDIMINPLKVAIKYSCSDGLLDLILEALLPSFSSLPIEKWRLIFIEASIRKHSKYLKIAISAFLHKIKGVLDVSGLKGYFNSKYKCGYTAKDSDDYSNVVPHYLLEHALVIGSRQVVELLIKYGAELDFIKNKYKREVIPDLIDQPFFHILISDDIDKLRLWGEYGINLEFGYYEKGRFKNLLILALERNVIQCAEFLSQLYQKSKYNNKLTSLDYLIAILPKYDKKLINLMVSENLLNENECNWERADELVKILKFMPRDVFVYLTEKYPTILQLKSSCTNLEGLIIESKNPELIQCLKSLQNKNINNLEVVL